MSKSYENSGVIRCWLSIFLRRSHAGCSWTAGVLLMGACWVGLAGCVVQETTGGPSFERPALVEPLFNQAEAHAFPDVSIDVSSVDEGYVSVFAQSESKVKFRVQSGGEEAIFDVAGDGTPLVAPLVMGDGVYEFTAWKNTSGDSYVELASLHADVRLASEFAPFLLPNVYCDFNKESACVLKANELAAAAENEGDVLRAVCSWVVDAIAYDQQKAAELSKATGYIPNPDKTLATGSGICFDYASLTAAMLRSQGIPCKIVVGEVFPEGVYHAWNLVYIDGSWHGTQLDANANEWTLVDPTFAAGGSGSLGGEGRSYQPMHVY